jgi:arylsulfatase A-like enzyme
MIKGADIKQGKQIGKAEIIDLAPTILHILGEPVPRDMDGRVLKEIFSEQSKLYKAPVAYQETTEKDRLKQKIRRLKSSGKI